jgi:NADPH2:quinone reductase
MPVIQSNVVRVHQHGGIEALRYETCDVADPGPGQVRLRQTAIGLNFIDTYHRTGLYSIGDLPAVLGSEGAGIVEAVGSDVDAFAVGDRVAYGLGRGAYAEYRLIGAASLIPLPDTITEEQAAAMMLKGMTADYLLRRTYKVAAGDTVLVHAASGGVGSILCQWASALGARVIGTVGSDDKAVRAQAHGCAETIVYTREPIVDRVRALTDGDGVNVVYDGVGKATFDDSLASLKSHGMLVAFGNASGAVPPFDILRLAKGGHFVARPSLAAYVSTREELLASANTLFAVVAAGTVAIDIGRRFPLSEVQAAHKSLESRETVGSTVLIP